MPYTPTNYTSTVTAADLNKAEDEIAALSVAVGSGSGAAPPFGLNVAAAPYLATGLEAQLDAATRINDAMADANAIGDNTRNSRAGGAQVVVPYGGYTLDAPIGYRGGVMLAGSGRKSTVFLRKANTTTELLAAASLEENAWTVRDVGFDGNRANQSVAATAVALSRGSYPADEVPADVETVPFVGGGDAMEIAHVNIKHVLGKGMTLTDQVSGLRATQLYIWHTSDHGVDDNSVDSEWGFAHIARCGRACIHATGANDRYSHLKLYESDLLGEGWPAFDIAGREHTVELAEIQEAGFSGIRVAGTDHDINVRVSGCNASGVVIAGSGNHIVARVTPFFGYIPTYLAEFGTNAFGNVVELFGHGWSQSVVKGDVVGNEVYFNGSRI